MAQNGLTPVTRVRHGHRFWKRYTSFEFARDMVDCPVAEAEILQAAANFPIAFRKSKRGFYPVAILSMTQDKPTPYVSAKGEWRASYVPSALRCVPFQSRPPELQDKTGEGEFDLLVNESLELVTDNPDDEPFFDRTGALGAELRNVQAFFRTLTASLENTYQLCRTIGDMGLFSPLACAQMDECLDGYFGVKLGALRQVPSAHLSLLATNGGLRLIHAHQVSLTHCAWLLPAQMRVEQLEKKSSTGVRSGASEFMEALAAAQRKESLLDHRWQEGQYAI